MKIHHLQKLDWNSCENPTSVTYEEGVYVGYRYFNTFNIKPSYEFGWIIVYFI
jgi:hypothetical protein